MTTQHYHLTALIRARNRGNHVVARLALRIAVVHNVELELHLVAVSHQTLHAAVVVVADHHRRYRRGFVIAAMLLRHNNPFAARRVVDAHHRAARHQHGVNLFRNLRRRIARRIFRRRRTAPGAPARPCRIVLRLHLLVGSPLRRGREVDRHHRPLPNHHHLALHGGLCRRQPFIKLVLDRPKPNRRPATSPAPVRRGGWQRPLWRKPASWTP